MTKKYIYYIFSVALILAAFTNLAAAEPYNPWLIKSKSTAVYSLYMDGRIIKGDPNSGTTTSSSANTRVTLKGNQYVHARRWFTNKDTGAVRTYWANKPIVYEVDLSEDGNYKIDLAVMNYAGHPGWKKSINHFKVDVFVDNVRKGRLHIEASDTEIKTKNLQIRNIKAGTHRVKFIWKNDKYRPRRKQDANIEIHNTSIEKVD